MNPLWIRQIRSVLALELRKNLLSARALPVYFLAILPVGLLGLFAFITLLWDSDDRPNLNETSLIFAGIYQFILRGMLYMACVWTFMNLFRGEILDRSLHYYFLAPIRREVLVAGKFVSGFASTAILFSLSTIVSMGLMYSVQEPGEAAGNLLGGAGLGQMIAYVGVTLLACLGYGAVFLFVGLFFRNPIIPAAIIFIWEAINPFLPALLKKISVIFYLTSLLPVDLPGPVYEIIAEPVPAWLAIPGFFLFTAAMLTVSSLRIRGMEISYSSE